MYVYSNTFLFTKQMQQRELIHIWSHKDGMCMLLT
jgi:hypothetical protein